MSFRVSLPGAEVLFSTREGGFSEGAFESLNLGLLTGDDRKTVIRNRRRLAEVAGVVPENVAMGWQVHGTDIEEWGGPDPDTAFLDPQGGQLTKYLCKCSCHSCYECTSSNSPAREHDSP